jgi:uncharacterized alkaline shock family protein YloU
MDAKEPPADRAPGTTTFAPGVLLTLARLTALRVPGVVSMAPVPGGVNRLFRRGIGDGVRVEIHDDTVDLELYLVLESDTNVREISRTLQADVAQAIEHTVGMKVGTINIHIKDIAFE